MENPYFSKSYLGINIDLLYCYMFRNKSTRNSKDSVYFVIIISLLISLIDRQVEDFCERGLSAVHVIRRYDFKNSEYNHHGHSSLQ